MAVVLAVVSVLLGVGVDSSKLAFGAWAVAYHLWFLVTFVLLVLATPVAVAADRRWGLAVPAALAIAVAVIRHGLHRRPRALHRLPQLCVGLGSQLSAWNRLAQRQIARIPTATAGVRSAVVLPALITWGPYPISMIGVPGEEL